MNNSKITLTFTADSYDELITQMKYFIAPPKTVSEFIEDSKPKRKKVDSEITIPAIVEDVKALPIKPAAEPVKAETVPASNGSSAAPKIDDVLLRSMIRERAGRGLSENCRAVLAAAGGVTTVRDLAPEKYQAVYDGLLAL